MARGSLTSGFATGAAPTLLSSEYILTVQAFVFLRGPCRSCSIGAAACKPTLRRLLDSDELIRFNDVLHFLVQ